MPKNPAASRRSLFRLPSTPRRRGAAMLGAVLTMGLLGASGAAGAATTPAPTAASGTLASLSGTSIEVQNPSSGQVTVTWTPTTTFRQTVTVPATTLAVGDCVTATAAPTSKSKKSTKSSTTSITATTVSISQPSATGSCSVGTTGGAFVIGGGGFAGAGGFAGRGFSGGTGGRSGSFRPPSGTFPKGGATRTGAFANVAFGKVTSLKGDVLVVVGTRPKFTAPPKGTSTKGKTKTAATTSKPKLVTTTSKVTFTTSTTFNETMSASSTALVVGQCVTALGPASDTGAITATTISVRPAGPSGCFTFTGGAGFRGGAGAGAGATTT
jgi:hypothetical protein